MIKKWAEQIDGQVMLLFCGMLFFAGFLLLVEWKFNSDAVVFQAVSNILSGFAGAFFGILTGKAKPTSAEHPPTLAPPVEK